MANPQIVVDFTANTSQLQSGVSQVESTGQRLGNTFKGVATGIATGLAVGAVVQFGKSAVQAAQESEEATARLDAVFRAMGDSTGQASLAAQEYASQLSAQIGVEDEVIMKAQAMLATFGEVSSETARQAGIFDRATAAAADLAAAGFGTMEGNAVQLGKALQDPANGLAALARSGVTFTDSQKQMITAMAESGNMLGAQKLVLQAIETQVQGTAAATASEADKMKIAFGELSESIGAALLPVVQQLAPLLQSLAEFIAKNVEWLVPLGAAFLAAAVAMKVLTVAQIALNIAMSANVLGLIVLGIAAVIAAAVLLAKNWDTVTDVVKKGFQVIKTAAQAVFNWVKANWPLLVGIMVGPMGIAVALIITHWEKIKAAARTAVNMVKSVWETLKSFFSGIASAIGAAINKIAAFFQKPVDAAQDMLAGIKSAVGKIADFISNQVGRVSAAIQRIVNAIKVPINAVLSAWNAIGFTVPTISVPPVSVAGHEVFGGVTFGGWTIGTPDIPLLAKGAVISSPTLAMVGEGAGREIVAPESLLRQVMAENAPEIHVYIGDQELKGMIRVEVATQNTRVARTLLGGRA